MSAKMQQRLMQWQKKRRLIDVSWAIVLPVKNVTTAAISVTTVNAHVQKTTGENAATLRRFGVGDGKLKIRLCSRMSLYQLR